MIRLSRRELLRWSVVGSAAGSLSGWMGALAAQTAASAQRARACILLWMPGGPSQIDTFDLKPGHAHGGPFQEIATSVPGIRISEHLPRLAARMEDLAIIRSMSSKEGDHSRATYYLHTGYLPASSVQYPSFGALIGKELGAAATGLPNLISIAPRTSLSPAAFSAGFLGSRHAPLVVNQKLAIDHLSPPNGVTPDRAQSRLELLKEFEAPFAAHRPDRTVASRLATYEQADRLMRPAAAAAFDLSQEPEKLRDAYGRGVFGQGCLLARRLVERGVPFVEVALSDSFLGWDTHLDNFAQVKKLSAELDAGWSTLLEDLRAHGLLESTTVVWMGEFGRTPKINPRKGRDHFPTAWTAVVAGGGVRGGQVIGRTSDDGMTVADRPVQVADLLATVCGALGVDPMTQNMSNVGRPIRLVSPDARPIAELLL